VDSYDLSNHGLIAAVVNMLKMRSKVVVLTLLALLISGIVIFRYRTASKLQVDPHAAHEIERAKQR
jgi:hypothetical protein